MIKVLSLTIYPLKGGRGVALDAMQLDPIGPRDDRRWMAVDQDGHHITQREVARLCQVVARADAAGLTLSAPYAPTVTCLRPDESISARVTVQVWDDQVLAVDLGNDAAHWLTNYLARPARLVYCPPDSERRTDRDYDPIGGSVSFADGFPILLAGQASLEDLNRRLDAPLPMNRFRPNIVVGGTEPFDEDQWKRFTINDITFDAVKPCARCVVTTTDQDTTERNHEPLRTLATFRKRGGGVMFGVNVVHRGTGVIRVGDLVSLEATR
jgi:uncharacterized protein